MVAMFFSSMWFKIWGSNSRSIYKSNVMVDDWEMAYQAYDISNEIWYRIINTYLIFSDFKDFV